ncbi:MAG: MBL fold metallo-hydrolase [Patescibacteria group bacterium]
MQLTWLGQSCFKIETKGNGESVTVVIDPFGDDIGLTMPKIKADIALISHDHFDHNNLDALKGEPFVIRGSGEYEVKQVVVYGVPTWHDDKNGAERGPNTCFRIDAEDLTVVHLGDLGHALTDQQLDLLEGADILLIPVGGTYTLNAKQASEVVSQIEPRLVIPMHYAIPGLKIDLDAVTPFLKEMGVPKAASVDKLKVTKKELQAEDLHVVVLNQSA